MDSSTWVFCLLTGIGDGIGVGLGHVCYKTLKGAAIKGINHVADTDWEQPDLSKESKISSWLACAAFTSGAIWQPTVNALSSISNDALFMAPMTGLPCGIIFLGGLRAGRRVFALEPTRENAKDDALLSLKVGGGTGLFVTTIPGLQHNAFEWLLGITGDMALFDSCVVAGSSTFIGFFDYSGTDTD